MTEARVASPRPVPRRVLVVEDEWTIAEYHADRLRDVGCDVVGPVGSVEAALGRISQECIDAALLDVRLSGEDTFRIADALAGRAIPFIFVTGFAGEDLPPRFTGRPVLQKPVPPNALESAIRLLCARR